MSLYFGAFEATKRSFSKQVGTGAGGADHNPLHSNYLQYLLPLITQYTQCNQQQYKAIDDFLMPIWEFNQITAKAKMDRDQIKKHISAIIKNSFEDNSQGSQKENNIKAMNRVFKWACFINPPADASSTLSDDSLVACLDDQVPATYNELPYVGQLFMIF